jgi:quinol monooxygenase YgiN
MEKIYALVTMRVEPGHTEAFIAAARACHDAASQDLAGTHAYEWFLSDDGLTATVVEAYDDAEALAHHGRVAGPAVAGIREHARLAIEFAGDVPKPVLDRMRERLGDVPFRGRRILGRMSEPSVGRLGTQDGKLIVATASFTVHPGEEARFRGLAEECFDRVVANEPGTIGYEWFLSENGRECLTIDIYRDADALSAHMANAGPVMARIIPVVDSRTAIYGAVPPEVRARLKPELGTIWGGRQLHGVI